jgi:formylglycine-generating enzyme required for sulfatase activity
MTRLLCLALAAALASGFATSAQQNGPPKKDVPKHFTNSIGMKFVWVPPGSFLMGSTKEEMERQPFDILAFRQDETQHKVTLTKGFYMAVCTVTQEQWQAVMGNNPSYFKGERDLPVERVSWNDCQEFINKLRGKDRKPYRLPTEAEWEYACRAGTTTPFYCGGTISTGQANYDGNFTYGNGRKGVRRGKTTPVGSFPANAWGLYDMHGNVWQWCQDWLGDYPHKEVVDPQGPATGVTRVMRGGSYSQKPEDCRSAKRNGGVLPNRRDAINIGFRLCFSVD